MAVYFARSHLNVNCEGRYELLLCVMLNLTVLEDSSFLLFKLQITTPKLNMNVVAFVASDPYERKGPLR